MIISRKPITLAEVKAYMKNLEEKKQMEEYLRKFVKLSKEKAVACTEEIQNLKNNKMRGEHIIKLADFLPQNIEDINKIFSDVSLTEEESNELISIIKKY